MSDSHSDAELAICANASLLGDLLLKLDAANRRQAHARVEAAQAQLASDAAAAEASALCDQIAALRDESEKLARRYALGEL